MRRAEAQGEGVGHDPRRDERLEHRRVGGLAAPARRGEAHDAVGLLRREEPRLLGRAAKGKLELHARAALADADRVEREVAAVRRALLVRDAVAALARRVAARAVVARARVAAEPLERLRARRLEARVGVDAALAAAGARDRRHRAAGVDDERERLRRRADEQLRRKVPGVDQVARDLLLHYS